MPRYRMMYAKEGPARYISHLDLLRTFLRAARRAGLPLALTQGFNPHPKLAFAAPLGVGIAGEAEFAELELARDVPAREVIGALSVVLPEGLRLHEIRSVSDSRPALMSKVDRATYRACAKLSHPVSSLELEEAIAGFLSQPQILVWRQGKAGEKQKLDIKPGVFAVSGSLNNGIIIIEAELKTGSKGNVRFDEFLDAFVNSSRLPLQGRFLLSRTGIFAAGKKGKKTLWEV